MREPADGGHVLVVPVWNSISYLFGHLLMPSSCMLWLICATALVISITRFGHLLVFTNQLVVLPMHSKYDVIN
jgi:hypothetical protein